MKSDVIPVPLKRVSSCPMCGQSMEQSQEDLRSLSDEELTDLWEDALDRLKAIGEIGKELHGWRNEGIVGEKEAVRQALCLGERKNETNNRAHSALY